MIIQMMKKPILSKYKNFVFFISCSFHQQNYSVFQHQLNFNQGFKKLAGKKVI